MKGVVALFLLITCASSLSAQDRAWVRMWEDAQRERPHRISSSARIGASSERGTPLVVHGRVFQDDGKSPAPGILIFAYQTDASGVYHTPRASGYRLKGWARTDAEGRFEFHTIRPGSYPGGTAPAHIHFTIEGPSLPRRWTADLNFANDPLVTQDERRKSAALGKFGSVRPVTVREKVEHVDFNIRISDAGKF